jgi:hypothetical protein
MTHRDGYFYYTTFQVSKKVSIPIQQWEPPRDYPVFVCDEYEEKPIK